MNAKECREVRREIDESVLGERLSARVEGHVQGCAACEQFRAERKHLRELVGSLEPVAAPPDFDMRLRARIAREQSTPRQPFFRFAVTTPAIALAGLLVVVIAAVVWNNQRNRTEPSSIASVPANELPTKDSANVTVANTESKGSLPTETSGPEQKRIEPQKPSVAFRPNLKSVRGKSADDVSDFTVKSAETFRVGQDRAGVSLAAPANPMVISVPDGRGGTRKILLPPVTLGSQRLVDNRTPVSLTNSRDW
jgi:hypothetical protein